MSTRPRDWAPLTDRDPLPGDPDAITTEATRLRHLTAAMRTQLKRLREIGSDTTGHGLYADKLREGATDLAEKMTKIIGRYDTTATALRDWAPELDRHQHTTLRARTKAQAAEELRRTNTILTAALPLGVEPTPEQTAEARTRAANLDEAATMLRQARDTMHEAVHDARTRGRHYRNLIRDAIDDDATDSRWDNIKDFVDRNTAWIRSAAKILGNIATVLAVISIFVPGLNMIVLGLTIVVTAAHLALALSGNGSWTDLIIDGVALASFGVATIAGRGLKATQATTRQAGARAAEKAALAQTRNARVAAGRRAGGSGARAHQARRFIRETKAEARQARHQFQDAPLPKASAADRWSARGATEGRYLADIHATRARFPGDTGVARASANTEDLLRRARNTWYIGAGTDMADKAADYGVGETYERLKGPFKAEVGSTW